MLYDGWNVVTEIFIISIELCGWVVRDHMTEQLWGWSKSEQIDDNDREF